MRRRRLGAMLLLLPGCVYLNGIYNARQAEKSGDQLRRRGRDAEAVTSYVTAAEKAETVLVRHPSNRWLAEALYLAGRGWALGGQCGRAVPRLEAYLVLPGIPADRRARATLALGICRVETGRLAAARALLEPLGATRDRALAEESAVWAARAAIAMGDLDGARHSLRAATVSVAEWELAGAYLQRGDLGAAESLLVRRASHKDYRPAVVDALPRLWKAGRAPGVARIVDTYDRARLEGVGRARLHLVLGELLAADGRTSEARPHFALAQRAARDSAEGREAAARLVAMAIHAPTSLSEVAYQLARVASEVAGTVLGDRLTENILLVQILAGRSDGTGASLFLAGEVARDSLEAWGLAHTLFKQVATTYPYAPLAAKALLAASALAPDSAAVYHQRLRTTYPASPYARALDGRDGSDGIRTDAADRLLVEAWTTGTKIFADSLAAIRRARAAVPGGGERGGASSSDVPSPAGSPQPASPPPQP